MAPGTPHRGQGRLGSRKSTDGCVTCKIRRVKCDEQRPHCQRCLQTGRRCDGYRGHHDIPSTAENPYQDLGQRLNALDAFEGKDPLEVRYFEFFVDQVLPGFSRIIDDTLWHNTIPQLSRTQPPIWDAVIALSCLVRHPQFSAIPRLPGSKRIAITDFHYLTALNWYNKSLRGLQKYISQQTSVQSWTLVACILYMCIESLQDNIAEALFLYQRAVAMVGLVDDQRFDYSSNMKLRNSIRALLRHESVLHGLPIPRPQNTSEPVIGPFKGLQDAREELYLLICETQTFVQSSIALMRIQSKDWLPCTQMLQQQCCLRDNLLKWHYALSSTVDSLKATSTPDQNELISVLRIAYRQYFVWVSCCLNMSESSYDDYLDDFTSMVEDAETIVDIGAQHPRPIFLFETRVIPSLYFVITKCREPTIRREALNILKRGPKAESTWKADPMAYVAQKIVGIEESGSAQGPFNNDPPPGVLPPETHRVYAQEVVEHKNNFGTSSHFLVVCRWQQNSDHQWFRDEQSVRL